VGEIKPRFSEADLVTRAPRFSTAIEENVPRPLGAHRTASLFVALASLRSTANQDIHDHYRSTFGPVPPILRQSCCECVHSLVHLLAREAVGLPPRRDGLRNESADLTAPNLWPASPPGLREAWTEYYRAMGGLARTLMRIFALALGHEDIFSIH
jgi:hypothetical protein